MTALAKRAEGAVIPASPQPRLGLLLAMLLCVVAAMLHPPGVLAESASGEAHADEFGGELEEITVSARRRPELLQEVPVAVSVMSGAQLTAHNLVDLQDISAEVPSVEFRTGASNKDRDIFIRGIGTITTSPGVEPSVSMVIDGVVLARPGQATLELLDVDRIEILRGPQGTLFGKNALAGVVNVVTTDPGGDLHGYVDGSYFGGGDEYRIKGGISGTLVEDRLAGSFSGVYSHYGGNVDNLFNGTTVNGYERYGGHAKFLYTPSDALRVTFNGDYLRSTDTVPTGVFATTAQIAYPTGEIVQNPALAAVLADAGVAPSYRNVNISDNLNSNVGDQNGGGSVTLEYGLGGYTLTSISAYRKWQNDQHQDYDQVSELTAAFPEIEDLGRLSFHQVSEEARIASPKGRFVDYVGGLYYLRAVDTEIYQRNVELSTAGGVVANSGTAVFGTHADDYSIFGEGSFNFTAAFRGILGARLTHDGLDYDFQRASTSPVTVPAIQPSFASTGSTSSWGHTDRVGLQYDVDKGIHTYVTYSQGYAGPAYNVFFNMAPSATIPLKPETANAYELGVKSRSADGRLQLNLAAYLTDFDNYQANFVDVLNGALVTRLINAGQVSTRGVEADFALRPFDDLTLSGAGARNDAKVDHFNCPPQSPASCNINGRPLPFAPAWRFNADATYRIPVANALRVVLDTDYRWQSEVQYQLAQTPATVQAAFGMWDAGVGLENDGQGWRIGALVKNIGNTHYSSYLAPGDIAGVVRWVPRDYGRYVGIEVHRSF